MPSPDVAGTRSRLESQWAELSALPTEMLREELLKALQWTSEGLIRIALIVRALEERGEDLRGLRITLLPYLRQIAYGQVLPEVVVRFGESPLLVRYISRLTIPEQERLARGESVALAVHRDDGGIDHRLVDPLYLRREQVSQVFARDRIRPLEEQVVMLEGRPGRTKPRKSAGAPGARVRPDPDRNGLMVGRTFVPAAEVVEALAALRGAAEPDDEGDAGERKSLPLYLTASQHERLRTLAYEGNTRMTTLAKRALAAYGLI